MALLDDIIDSASSDTATTTNLLRKVQTVAFRLRATDLRAWVDAELNGYREDATEVPKYRGPFVLPVRGILSGPFGSGGKTMVSRGGVPDGYDHLFEVTFREGIASLEDLAASEREIGIPWDPHFVALYNQWMEQGRVARVEMMGLYSANQVVTKSLLRGIVDNVRTKALELALELQSQIPDAGEVDGPTTGDPAVASQVTNITTNIYGSNANVAQGNTVTQTITVVKGDVASLAAAASKLLDRSSDVGVLVALTTSAEPDEVKRGKIQAFGAGVRDGSIALASGLAANVGADRIIEFAHQFLGW